METGDWVGLWGWGGLCGGGVGVGVGWGGDGGGGGVDCGGHLEISITTSTIQIFAISSSVILFDARRSS